MRELTKNADQRLLLAAVGLANREIAQHLFVTARTVEGHLTHTDQKPAISSREQLAAALATRDVSLPAPAPTPR
ncbi:MAG: hypothetical protein JOZ98_06335 [Solirubrobacterales bacterium]|nr:hypothetical protein [Solirubrobacterales bacterium]